MPLLVGTSGWQYRHWRGVLYPQDVPQRRWLEHYASQYATVENDGTFYRLPARDTFADWRARTPGGFVMAVKASRYLTHVRRLREPAEPVARLLAAASGLGDRLGPVLLQLPPTVPADPPLLAACLAEFARAGAASGLGGPVRVAVEPRHRSWWTQETHEVLAAHGAALCWADQLGRPVAPLWRTAAWGYLRLHQGAARPWPRYGERALRSWLARLSRTWPDEAPVHVFFNNDPGGAAVADSIAFAALARRAGLAVTRTPAGAPDAERPLGRSLTGAEGDVACELTRPRLPQAPPVRRRRQPAVTARAGRGTTLCPGPRGPLPRRARAVTRSPGSRGARRRGWDPASGT